MGWGWGGGVEVGGGGLVLLKKEGADHTPTPLLSFPHLLNVVFHTCTSPVEDCSDTGLGSRLLTVRNKNFLKGTKTIQDHR